MDADLFIIMVMIVLTTAISFAGANGIVAKVLEYKREKRRLETAPHSLVGTEVAERTSLIEDRLAVLERIATDRGQLLSDEIEALRAPIASTKTEEAN